MGKQNLLRPSRIFSINSTGRGSGGGCGGGGGGSDGISSAGVCCDFSVLDALSLKRRFVWGRVEVPAVQNLEGSSPLQWFPNIMGFKFKSLSLSA